MSCDNEQFAPTILPVTLQRSSLSYAAVWKKTVQEIIALHSWGMRKQSPLWVILSTPSLSTLNPPSSGPFPSNYTFISKYRPQISG